MADAYNSKYTGQQIDNGVAGGLDFEQSKGQLVSTADLGVALSEKVDKVAGKQLSTNDFTNADKNKLSSIQDEATHVDVDSALDSNSANPVQNKAISIALEQKVDKITGKQLSTNDYTDADKNKLAGIAPEANKTIVETEVTGNSTNPVQSKAIRSFIVGESTRLEGKIASNTSRIAALEEGGGGGGSGLETIEVTVPISGKDLELTGGIEITVGSQTSADIQPTAALKILAGTTANWVINIWGNYIEEPLQINYFGKWTLEGSEQRYYCTTVFGTYNDINKSVYHNTILRFYIYAGQDDGTGWKLYCYTSTLA